MEVIILFTIDVDIVHIVGVTDVVAVAHFDFIEMIFCEHLKSKQISNHITFSTFNLLISVVTCKHVGVRGRGNNTPGCRGCMIPSQQKNYSRIGFI